MYKLLKDFIGNLPQSEEFLIPIIYIILILILITFVCRLVGFKL